MRTDLWLPNELATIKAAYMDARKRKVALSRIAPILTAELGRSVTKNVLIGLSDRHGWIPEAARKKQEAETPPTVRPRACQWLHGEPSERRFCGEAALPGMPYCAAHAKRAYIRHPALPMEAEL